MQTSRREEGEDKEAPHREEHIEEDGDDVTAKAMGVEAAHCVGHPSLWRPEVLTEALVGAEHVVEDKPPSAAEGHAHEHGRGRRVDQPKLVDHGVDE